MTPKPTFHLQEQIRKMREQGIAITLQEVLYAVNNFGEFPAGLQTRVEVKKLPKRVTWNDRGIKKTGDLLIAMVDVRFPGDEGRIATVMTRKSSQDCTAHRKPGENDIVHSS